MDRLVSIKELIKIEDSFVTDFNVANRSLEEYQTMYDNGSNNDYALEMIECIKKKQKMQR